MRKLSDEEIAMIMEVVEAREMARLCRCGHSRVAARRGRFCASVSKLSAFPLDLFGDWSNEWS